MKRFFTKKSVALVLATIALVGSFSFGIVKAQTSATMPINPTCTTAGGGTYVYNAIGDNLWHSSTESNPTKGIGVATNGITNCLDTNGITATTLAQRYDDALRQWHQENDVVTVKEEWSILGALSNYVTGAISFFSGTGTIIGLLKIVNMVVSLFVAVTAFLFDQSVNMSISKMAGLFNVNGVVDFIWTMIRDLINISFIFILLYIAITRIIGSWGVKAKTTIINVIISAIFINFSMLIAKMLIDAGNMVAIQLHNSILATGATTFSTLVVGSLNLEALTTNVLSVTGQFNMIISSLLSIALSAILIWVFLFGAFVLIGRIVMLILLTMTSPIGFVGKTIPALGEYSTAWWKSFMDQILVAPALMFILLIVAKLLTNQDLKNIISSSTNENPLLDTSSFLFYILIIMLLVKGMGYVKKLSGEVAGTVVKAVGVAAAVGATAITGGASLGAGVLSAGASAAGNAAKAEGKSPWAARLAFSAKNLGESSVGKFVTGKYDKTGAIGMATTFIRDKTMGGIKEATGGVIDAKKLEKRIEKAKKDIETNITKKSENIGPQKHFDRQKQLKDIKANITVQAEMRMPEDMIKIKPSEKEKGKNIDETIEKAEKNKTEKAKDEAEKAKALEEKKKVLDTSEENLKKAEESKNPVASGEARKIRDNALKEHSKADNEYTTAHNDFATADQKVTSFKKYAEALEKEEKKVAEEMGTSMDKIAEEEKGLIGKIAEGVEKRNEYIKSISDKGMISGWLKTGLLFGDDRKKLIEKIKAQKGKFTTDEDKMIKKFKDFVKKEEEKETGEATPEGEPKSKEEKTESEPKAE